MNVTVRGEQKQINVQTITLHPEDGNNLYALHCTACGNFYLKVGGKVSKIDPLYELSDQVPVVGRCHNCHEEIIFQTHDGYSPDRIKVTLNPISLLQYFYCWRAKDKILEYSSTGIFSFVDNAYKALPFEVECPHPDCSIVYLFDKLL